jgi:outer membrane protein assembly factor BamD
VKFFYRILFLSLAALIANGCATTNPDPAVKYQNQSYEQLFHRAENNLARGKNSTAIKQYEALDALYPFNPHTEQAQLDMMYAYYETGDMASTVASAERFIRLYPDSPHADYAYYMKGLANFSQDRGWMQRYFPTDLSRRDPGTAYQAFDDFAHLIHLYPNSCYACDARQRMVYLRDLFANHELHVATYYYRRGAFVASANRATYILDHYEDTPQVEPALGMLVRSYRELGLVCLSDEALHTLEMNFPNGIVYRNLCRPPRS